MGVLSDSRKVLNKQEFSEAFNENVERVVLSSTNIEAISLALLLQQENRAQSQQQQANGKANPIKELEKQLEELHSLVLPSYREYESKKFFSESGSLREAKHKKALISESDPGLGYFQDILGRSAYKEILDIKSSDSSVELGQVLKSLFIVLDRIISSRISLNPKKQANEVRRLDLNIINNCKNILDSSLTKLLHTLSEMMSMASDSIKQLSYQEIMTNENLMNVKQFLNYKIPQTKFEKLSKYFHFNLATLKARRVVQSNLKNKKNFFIPEVTKISGERSLGRLSTNIKGFGASTIKLVKSVKNEPGYYWAEFTDSLKQVVYLGLRGRQYCTKRASNGKILFKVKIT